MGMVSIVCPNTGKIVPTGVLMSEVEFAGATLGSNNLRCPACGRIHVWSKADAHLVSEPAQK